jgi:hypothetical protein
MRPPASPAPEAPRRAPEINDDYGTPEEAPAPEEQGGGGPAWGEILNSPIARSIATQVTRGLMGALLGKAPSRPRARRRRY